MFGYTLSVDRSTNFKLCCKILSACVQHTCVCIRGLCGSSAVGWLVVVLVVLGQGRPGLLHLLSFLSTSTAPGFRWVYHHAKLLAQVCHLIWGTRMREGFKDFLEKKKVFSCATQKFQTPRNSNNQSYPLRQCLKPTYWRRCQSNGAYFPSRLLGSRRGRQSAWWPGRCRTPKVQSKGRRWVRRPRRWGKWRARLGWSARHDTFIVRLL